MVFKLLHQYTIPVPGPIEEPNPVPVIGTDTPTSWKAFQEMVQRERNACSAEKIIKVIYLLRHAHGEHNSLPKNPLPHWKGLGVYNPEAIDPLLSQIGKEQMENLSSKLQSELASHDEGMALPTKVYTSILRRTCQCSLDVWAPICQAPIIALQDLRGTLIGLGYSKRGPLSAVKARFPSVVITEGTTEEDDLWLETGGNETEEEAGKRIESVFKQVWDMAKDDQCIAIVSHKELFNTLWPQVFGLEEPRFQTAEMRVVIVKQFVL